MNIKEQKEYLIEFAKTRTIEESKKKELIKAIELMHPKQIEDYYRFVSGLL